MPLYFRNVGTAWNSTTSWSTVSSTGASAGVIPTSIDDVIFDGNSAATCPVTTTIGLCRNLTTTGWTGTITLNVDLRVLGNIFTSSGTTVNGVGWFSIVGPTNKTMNSNGASFLNFQLGVAGPAAHILTFNDTLNVTNIRHGVANAVTTNGSQVNVSGSMTMENVGIVWSGTTVYNLIGSGNGTFGMANTTPSFGSLTININKSGGTITFLNIVKLYGTTFNYIAGTINTTTNSSVFDLYGNGTLVNTITSKTGINEITFNDVRMGFLVGIATTNLLSNMKISGNLTCGPFGVNVNTSNGSFVELIGNLFYGGNGVPSSQYLQGTSFIKFTGSTDTVIEGIGTQPPPTPAVLLIGINLEINKSVGKKVTLTPTNVSPKIYLVPGGTAGLKPMSITVTSGILDAEANSIVVVGSAGVTNLTTLTLNTGSSTVNFPNLNIEAAGNQLNIN